MEKNKCKSIKWKQIVAVSLTVVALYFLICPMIRVSIFETNMGECISVSLFGKWELRGIDKVVMTVRNKQIVITDNNLVKQIADETRIATHVRSQCGAPAHCDDPQGRLELYRGDELVRSMDWDLCCDMVKVYEGDATHWLIPWFCKSYGGYVYLSNGLTGQLYGLADAG
jgi:hypothetical protein